jgi:hypothetical protein
MMMKASPVMHYRDHLHPGSREIMEAKGGGCLHLRRWLLAVMTMAKFNPLDLLRGGDSGEGRGVEGLGLDWMEGRSICSFGEDSGKESTRHCDRAR